MQPLKKIMTLLLILGFAGEPAYGMKSGYGNSLDVQPDLEKIPAQRNIEFKSSNMVIGKPSNGNILDEINILEQEIKKAEVKPQTGFGQKLAETKTNYYYCLSCCLGVSEGIWAFLSVTSGIAGAFVNGLAIVWKDEPKGESAQYASLALSLAGPAFAALAVYAVKRRAQLAKLGYVV